MQLAAAAQAALLSAGPPAHGAPQLPITAAQYAQLAQAAVLQQQMQAQQLHAQHGQAHPALASLAPGAHPAQENSAASALNTMFSPGPTLAQQPPPVEPVKAEHGSAAADEPAIASQMPVEGAAPPEAVEMKGADACRDVVSEVA